MTDPDTKVWDSMLAHLRTQHPAICRQWFEELEPLGVAGGAFHLRTSSDIHREYLRHKCADPFNDAARTVSGRLISVRFLGPEDPPPEDVETAAPGRNAGRGAPRPSMRAPARDAAPRAAEPARAESTRADATRGEAGRADARGDGVRGEPSREQARVIEPKSDGHRNDGQAGRVDDSGAGGGSAGSRGGDAVSAPARSRVFEGPNPGEQRYESLVINPDNAFENFVVGPGNRLAHAAAQAVAANPGRSYNPFFVHGGVGLGKTHLLQAVCLRLFESNPGLVMYYTSCEAFVTQFIESVQSGEMGQFRHRFRDVDVLVIDDIHFLAKRDRTQEEFFHTFNSLYQANKQIILSSDAPPHEIPDLEDRLVSRFKWGLVAKIEPPCYETRVAILRTKARLRGMPISDEVACYIAGRIDSNIRELEGAIVGLQMRAMVEQRPIDLELARLTLGDEAPAVPVGEPTIQHIINVVVEFYGIKVTDLQSKHRHRSITLPRQVCMYIAKRVTRHSLAEIGGYMGGRDHTTVLHAINVVEAKRDSDGEFAAVLKSLEERARGPRVG